MLKTQRNRPLGSLQGNAARRIVILSPMSLIPLGFRRHKGAFKKKLGYSRRMLKSGSPKALWDHCIELEALIHSHTSLDIYGLGGQVPETVISGQTGDINSLCKFEWFEWVMFFQPKETYPDDKNVIARWLGPAINVGTDMTYKILRSDGGYVCRSTLISWNSNEEANPVRIAERVYFMMQLLSCFIK